MGKKKTYDLYYIDNGSYVLEIFENAKDDYVTGVGAMFQSLKVTGEELMRYLGVPDRYVSLICHVFKIPRAEKVYLYQLQDFVRELRRTRIFKEKLTREDIIARTIRQETGASVDEVKQLLKDLIENIEPPE